MSLFDGAMRTIMANADENAATEDAFTGEDGFLHCRVCGEAVEAELPEELKRIFPNRKTRPRMCKCARDRADAEEVEEKKQQAQYKIDALKSEGLYSVFYGNCTFGKDDQHDQRASEIARKYVGKFAEMQKDNTGILFWGGVGTGKSYLAACIANALIEKLHPVMMAPIQDIVAAMTENYGAQRESVLAKVESVDLLILDDLGVERGTEYMLQHAYDIINARYNAKKPIIVTTNLTPQQMDTETNINKKRIYDRITETCLAVKIGGESRRGGIVREKAKRFKKLLEEGD